MTIGLKANSDGSGAVQTGGVDAIQISTGQAVTIPQTLAVTGAQTIGGNLTVTGNVSGAIKSGTAVASTSGTSIDFTSIPAGVKRITVIFSGVSISSSAQYLVQLGTGSTPTYTTSGYLSYCSYQGATNIANNYTSTSGFISAQAGGNNIVYGSATILNITSNTWVSNHTMGLNGGGTGYSVSGGGSIALGAVLTAVRITTTSTDTFDAGTINILYE